MNSGISLADAIDAYFAAKALLFGDAPDFRILRAGPLMCLHRHPGWPEVDGFYAVGGEPADVVAAVRDYKPHPSHMITVFTQAPEELWEPFQALGYAPLSGTQPFLGRSLSAPSVTQNRDVIEVRRTPSVSEYRIERDGHPVCWGSSVAASPQVLYVYGMETLPAYRRQGLASAVLDRVHGDAGSRGATHSILCSSRVGLPLYQKAGYALLAHMQGFVPQKQDGGGQSTG